MQDDLSTVKDDMVAFIEGHGMKRFHGYVTEEIDSVMWRQPEHGDEWKDFVELAKRAAAPFLTMNEVTLSRTDLDTLINRLKNATFPEDDDIEDAQFLKTYVGKTGFVQLGWPFQGVMFLYELSTEWYERYQRLLDVAEGMGGLVIDEHDEDEEH